MKWLKKDDKSLFHQNSAMKKEMDEEAAFLRQVRENEKNVDNEGKKKEKDRGNFFLSDRGQEIRQNLGGDGK